MDITVPMWRAQPGSCHQLFDPGNHLSQTFWKCNGKELATIICQLSTINRASQGAVTSFCIYAQVPTLSTSRGADGFGESSCFASANRRHEAHFDSSRWWHLGSVPVVLVPWKIPSPHMPVTTSMKDTLTHSFGLQVWTPPVLNDSLPLQFAERTKKHKEAIFPTIFPTCNSNKLWHLSGSRDVHGDIAPQAWHHGCMSCSTLPVFDALCEGADKTDTTLKIGWACRSSSIVPRKTMSDASHGNESKINEQTFRTEACPTREFQRQRMHLREFNPFYFCDRVEDFLSSRSLRIQRVVSSICTFCYIDCTKSISWISFALLGVRFCHSLRGFAYNRTATNQGRFLLHKPIQAIQ